MDQPLTWLKQYAQKDGSTRHLKVLEEGLPVVFKASSAKTR
jgi:hypothetical protein